MTPEQIDAIVTEAFRAVFAKYPHGFKRSEK